MNKKYLQKGFDLQLSTLIEECGECIAAAGKTQRFGKFSANPELVDKTNPNWGRTNLRWLLQEMDDVSNAITRLRRTIKREFQG